MPEAQRQVGSNGQPNSPKTFAQRNQHGRQKNPYREETRLAISPPSRIFHNHRFPNTKFGPYGVHAPPAFYEASMQFRVTHS